MNITNYIHTRNLRGDFFGGVTAAIVGLPMALAFGVASGAGAIAGIYSAVLLGFFAALFGGTPTLISNPTGPMTVVFTAVIASFTVKYPGPEGWANRLHHCHDGGSVPNPLWGPTSREIRHPHALHGHFRLHVGDWGDYGHPATAPPSWDKRGSVGS